MDDWIDYYDSAHTIYVNAHHRDVHFRTIADAIAAYVASPDTRVLDYGCGEALMADRVAAKASRLFLCEPAPGVRERLRRRFGANPRITVIGPDELQALADGSADLIVMHSVAQYLSPLELDQTLTLFRRLLAAHGMLVVGDVLQPHTSAVTDAVALLRFGAREGFFVAAFTGLLRTLFSSYWQLRSTLGLTRYSERAMLDHLAAAGFTGRRAAGNIGHNPARMTFLAAAAKADASPVSSALTGP
jgi:SAM-dependent methyltransferase